MAFSDFNNNYTGQYHQYPVYTMDLAFEGEFKRFLPMPDPEEVFAYAMMGLPKIFPLTNEPITIDSPVSVADALVSAVTEIEMDMGCNLSEVTHFHSQDYIEGMFERNYTGIKLHRWPATEITQVVVKYPHTNVPNTQLYQSYTVPPSWVYLKRNKMNVVAGQGAMSITTNSSANVSPPFGFLAARGGAGWRSWQPGVIEVVYKAGFSHDKLPAMVADLIRTWAAQRYLSDIVPVLFPYNSVTDSIDGISQSVGINVTQLITERTERLEKKKLEQKAAFKKAFGNTIGRMFAGA